MKDDAIEQQAIALTYDGKTVPKVSASGKAALAEKIIALAREHQIFIHQDPMLTAKLAELELGDAIPESLYTSIAILIAFAYRLNDKKP